MTAQNGSTKRVYLDYSASTPVAPEVVVAMEPYWSDVYGNAGAIHSEGVKAKEAITDARIACANLVHGNEDEIIFTSGGTESNSLAIYGPIKAARKAGRENKDIHVITSMVEHASVLDSFRDMENDGIAVSYLAPDKEGKITPESLQQALRQETVLISLMYVNSEIGTQYPLAEYAKVIREHKKKNNETVYPLFHTDASQGAVYCTIDVELLHVDLMTIDAQKMYGPKGIGFLYIRRGTPVAPILLGGDQERNMRAGTPNTPLIVGQAVALQLALDNRREETERVTTLRDYFIDRVLTEIPGAELNGARDERIAHNTNFAFKGQDAEMLVLRLDAQGIAASTKSACKGARGGSEVVRALGKGEEYAHSSIRFSLGRHTTKEDLDYTIETLKKVL